MITGTAKAIEILQRECSSKQYQKVGVRFRDDAVSSLTFFWHTEMAADYIGIPPLAEWDEERWRGFIMRGEEFYNTVSDYNMSRVNSVVFIDHGVETEIII